MSKHITLSQAQSLVQGGLNLVRNKHYAQEADLLSYTVKKQAEAESGYIATYQLFSQTVPTYVAATGNYVEGTTYYTDSTGATTVDTTGFDENTSVASYFVESVTETPVGQKINIPKDFLVTDVTPTPLTVASSDKETGGIFEDNNDFAVGDKYIRFTVNVKEGSSETPTYMYINLNSLVDTYTAGNGIDITSKAVSVKIDTSNANGLVTGANGLRLDTVVANTYTDDTRETISAAGHAGAMSVSDKEKLDDIELANASDIQTAIAALSLDSAE